MTRVDTAARVVAREALVAEARAWAARGERVALACGAFDLIHAGHARWLAAARGGATRLAVAVLDDPAAHAMLGPGRPVTGAGDRARQVAALACVDRVVVLGPGERDAAALGTALAAHVVADERDAGLLEADRARVARVREAGRP